MIRVPRARNTDPKTSHDAAATISKTKLRETQKAVLDVLGILGSATDEQLVDEYSRLSNIGHFYIPMQTASGIRTRRKELADRGLIKNVGRQKMSTGNMANVWRKIEED